MLIHNPLTGKQIRELVDKDGYGTVQIIVSTDDMISNDLEGFLDLMLDNIGDPLMADITYNPVSVTEDGSIVMEVSGYFSDDALNKDPNEN